MMYRRVGKRLVDVTISGGLLVLCAPVLAVVALLLWVTNNGQVFFIQRRPGLGGKHFSIYKFKTMNDARDAHGELLPDAVRTTPIGRVIRRCSFDELLQLLNVLKGDMSLIGPRPLLIEYLDHYSPFQHRRHEVRPGITGLAQVKGRNQLSWERRFRYDVFYVDHLSLSFDLYIIWETVKTVIAGNDTEFPSTLTCTRFSGSSYARRAVRATAQGE